jgi:hypothetical protein
VSCRLSLTPRTGPPHSGTPAPLLAIPPTTGTSSKRSRCGTARGGSFWSQHPRLPKSPIRAYQVWNEPELGYRWYAPAGSAYAWPRGYVTLLREAQRALRAFDPQTKIVLAGLTDDSWNALRRLYRVHARPYFDIAAIQAYTGSPRDPPLPGG